MFRHRFLPLICLLALAVPTTQAAREKSTEKPAEQPATPNVILIVADDLGWGDVGCFYQNERAKTGEPALQTPALDELAAGGAKLTSHYAGAPISAPSLASLWTGMHQGHARALRDNTADLPLENVVTIPSLLKQAGYQTALIGTWNMAGGEDGERSPKTSSAFPTHRGFDYFFGSIDNEVGRRHYPKEDTPAQKFKTNTIWDGETDITAKCDHCYTPDLYVARAKKWLVDTRKAAPKQPFFLALSLPVPSPALQLPAASYPQGGGTKGGLQWLDTPGKLINTADGKPDTYLDPRYAEQKWPDVDKRYATAVSRLDNAVGDLMALLKELGLDKNTIVVFTSTNGPANEAAYTGDAPDPTFFRSFGPFDGVVRDAWEGGFRVPAIVTYPAKIKAGTTIDTPSQFQDWMATFAVLSGQTAPAQCDGADLMPELSGTGTRVASTIYMEYNTGGQTPDYKQFADPHRQAVRGQEQVIFLKGYKGIRVDIKTADDGFAIFDVAKDPGERKNLAESNDMFSKMQAELRAQTLRVRRNYDYLNVTRSRIAKRPYTNELVPSLGDTLPVTAGTLSFTLLTDKPLAHVPSVKTPPLQPAAKPAEQISEKTVEKAADKHVKNGKSAKGEKADKGNKADKAEKAEKEEPAAPALPLGKPAPVQGTLFPDFVTPEVSAQGFTSEWTGYVKIPEDGVYHFTVMTDNNPGSKAFVHMHEFQLIDADTDYKPGDARTSTATVGVTDARDGTGKLGVPLQAGYHPIRIGYVHGAGATAPHLVLKWRKDADAEAADVPADALSTHK